MRRVGETERAMNKRVIITTGLLAFVIVAFMLGGFTTFAQMNIPKVGQKGVVEPIQDAQEKKMAELAEGTKPGTPAEEAKPAVGTVGEPISIEEVPEDYLREAIRAAAGYEAFADSATKTVRAYIRKIKIGPNAYEQDFEQGVEPWRSEKSELRYSPFDPATTRAGAIDLTLRPVPPFLPPLGEKAGLEIGLDILQAVIQLKMTSKSGDQYIALVEIAGQPIRLKVGDVLDPNKTILPSGVDIVVDEISMSGILFRSGTQVTFVRFAGVSGTEETPFEITVIK